MLRKLGNDASSVGIVPRMGEPCKYKLVSRVH